MTRQEKLLKSKIGLLRLVEELGNVSQACELMGFSRDSYYRFRNLYKNGGADALKEKSKKKPNYKNRTPKSKESKVVDIAFEQPFFGQSKASQELKSRGVDISPAGVRSVWQRYDLENFQKRIIALATRMIQESYHPNPWQIRALKLVNQKGLKLKSHRAYFPGNMGILVQNEIRAFKNFESFSQLIFLDSYSRMAFVKLIHNPNSVNVLEFLNLEVLPFFKKENLLLFNVICTKDEIFYNQSNTDPLNKWINKNKIKWLPTAKTNHTMNSMAGFERLIWDEFYTTAIRQNTYSNLEEIQTDINLWVQNYNRNHRIDEQFNYGKTPYKTYCDSIPFTQYLIDGSDNRAFPNGNGQYLDLLKQLVLPDNF